MHQTLENGKKTNFGANFGPFAQNFPPPAIVFRVTPTSS